MFKAVSASDAFDRVNAMHKTKNSFDQLEAVASFCHYLQLHDETITPARIAVVSDVIQDNIDLEHNYQKWKGAQRDFAMALSEGNWAARHGGDVPSIIADAAGRPLPAPQKSTTQIMAELRLK